MSELPTVNVEIFYTSIVSTDPQAIFMLSRRSDVRYVIRN